MAARNPNNTPLSLLDLPQEMLDQILEEYLYNQLNAPEYFNHQVRQGAFDLPPLARVNRELRHQCITTICRQMSAVMDIRRNFEQWGFWARLTVDDNFVGHLRKFEIWGPNKCDGFLHAKIFINLENQTTPVMYANQIPGPTSFTGCSCILSYANASQIIDQIIRQGHRPGDRLIMTTQKLLLIFRVVAGIQ